LLGIAVSTVYAATAALLEALTTIALRGPIPLLTSWQLYAVAVLGATGLLLNQVAFQAGPLSASLPAIATVDPLLSIVNGVTVYDEPIRHGLPAVIGLAVLLLVLSGSVIQLTRSAAPPPAEPPPIGMRQEPLSVHRRVPELADSPARKPLPLEKCPGPASPRTARDRPPGRILGLIAPRRTVSRPLAVLTVMPVLADVRDTMVA